MFAMPVILLFYNAHDLSVRHLFIIQAAYSITIVALEIPSGYLADVWGRKKTILLGAFLSFFGYFTYTLGAGFETFLLAEVLLGIGHSFISGTDTAMLYDTTIAMKSEDKYLKIEGRMTSMGNFAESIAGISGGLLAILSIKLPFVFQAFAALIAVPAAFLLVEPELHAERKKPSLKQLLQTFRNVLFENKILLRNIMLSSVLGASTLSMAWFVQPYFMHIELPFGLYGVLWTALNATVGIAALMAYKFEREMGEKRILIFIVLGTLFCYVSLWIFSSYWALIIIFIFYLIRGIATPVLKDYINKLISSDTRASVLSLRNLIIRVIFSSLGPIWGYVTDNIGLSTALLLAGTSYFVLAVPFLALYFVKSKN